jgi:hypothetical protein
MIYSLKLTKLQYLIILGTAISGLSSFVTTYDAIAKTAEKQQVCEETEDYKQALQTRFIVLMVLSCVAVVIGFILGFMFNRSESVNKHNVVTYGVITAGLFGIIYSLFSKFNTTTASMAIKLTMSWSSFLAFIALGFYFSRTNKYGDAASTTIANESADNESDD